MIIGEYHCCDSPLFIELPEVKLPKFLKETCPNCGKTVWHKLSRVDPESYTEESFLKCFAIDETNKTIKPIGDKNDNS